MSRAHGAQHRTENRAEELAKREPRVDASLQHRAGSRRVGGCIEGRACLMPAIQEDRSVELLLTPRFCLRLGLQSLVSELGREAVNAQVRSIRSDRFIFNCH